MTIRPEREINDISLSAVLKLFKDEGIENFSIMTEDNWYGWIGIYASKPELYDIPSENFIQYEYYVQMNDIEQMNCYKNRSIEEAIPKPDDMAVLSIKRTPQSIFRSQEYYLIIAINRDGYAYNKYRDKLPNTDSFNELEKQIKKNNETNPPTGLYKDLVSIFDVDNKFLIIDNDTLMI